MVAPKTFNIDTAAVDFAGPGRDIEIKRKDEREFVVRQMLVKVGNWTLSCVWGYAAYCTAARNRENYGVRLAADYVESPDAEIAAWRGEGRMIEIDGDSVIGWVSPAGVLAAIDAAERDDEDGIRAALVRAGAES